MKFGLFYEHQMARPWSEDHEHRLLKNALDQIEIADGLGFDYVWEVEHHFLEEYSHSSAPEVFLGAVSQRTKNIRLGHGIVNVMPGVNHPARVAERVAMLDLVSDGRVDLGTGESSSQAELGAFGIDRDQKRDIWKEALGQIAHMFVESPYAGHDGPAFAMPPRQIVPRPLQKPHPPLWVACSRRETIMTAAENGIGALSFAFIEPEQAKEWVDEYYAIIESDRCVPIGFDVNPNVAVVLPMLCHEDEEEAVRRGFDGANFFGYSLTHYYVFGEHRPGKTNIAEEFNERREEFGFSAQENITSRGGEALGVKLLQDGLGSLRGAIGTPEQIVGLVERYREAGVDQIIFVSQAGAIKHEHVVESYELFAREVMPHFRGEEFEQMAREKQERLAPAIEAALARRTPARKLDREYVIMPQSEPNPVGPQRTATGASSAAGSVNGKPAADAMEAALKNLRKKILRRVDKSQREIVARMSDDQLEKTIGSKLGVKLLFRGMERMYRPKRAGKFRGEIEFTLETPHGPEVWTVDIRGDRAVARPGAARDAKLRLKSKISDFVRLGTGNLDPGTAIMGGRMVIQGDIMAAAGLSEMFGGKKLF
ncbi:MAG TPA: LLM class flavin-dependent oxidoreductase [Solirubrobacterales bacterium]|jgi:alkanesulfonate monooxygenase SsuD/methylene tetrahydromethanopterin reductase-like flavin-dependent oxidoreductase (luciferase family)|nr:LLM class flavin-dependent oxidoreductase [Solirubrobacterales bacterium]